MPYSRGHAICSVSLVSLLAGFWPSPAAAEKLHFTYVWHLEQPIYWPDQQVGGVDRYELAWESILRTNAGAAHPANDLPGIFGLADRVAVYQWRARDCIDLIRGYPEAGAQITYSGGLVENITSLGNVSQLGYVPTWYSWLREARSWTTVGQAKPRADIVIFPFHHPLLPLCDDSAIRKEIQLYKAIYDGAWGASPALSRGFFPPEMAFSQRIIPILVEEGVDWALVSGEHLSRSCSDFPLILGAGGVNCDPPNKADQVNPARTNYYRVTISLGCAPAEAYPFAFTPHRAQYTNPDTGVTSSMIVVPCAQALSWENGYAPMGVSHFDNLEALNDPNRPMLVVMAHDGDNAWGGGYSYYMEATPQLVSQARAAQYTATVVEEYLADHPVPADDVVHVEQGGWVNPAGDFGAPMMLNWNWPLVNGQGQIDIANGWAEDERNWAVITAAQNRVDTAEQIAGGANIEKILYPDAATTPAERAWHYFLAALNSGYMYYGTSLDLEVKPTIACNEAVQHADVVIGDGALDATPPTIWIPQRHPWNPGSLNFGPQYGYQQTGSNGDFWVWTFAYDVSGIASVTLKYRVDADGNNPLASTQNETYAGGSEVGAWQSLPMTFRDFPAGNVFNNPGIDFFELPAYIADEYYVQITGLSDVLLDYHVEAIDGRGAIRRSPIQHVYVGPGADTPGGGDFVTVDPNPPIAGLSVTIRYNPVGGPLAGATQVYLHYGFNSWNPVISPDPPMIWNAALSIWQITVSVPTTATQLDMVFNNGAGTWHNNNGQDWHFTVVGGTPAPEQWVMDGVLDDGVVHVAASANGGLHLWSGMREGLLYLACEDAGEGNDHFILLADVPGPMGAAMWAKSGQVAHWDAFLADENNNTFEGWFDASAATQAATGANGGVLEGTIDLEAELGGLPTTIYLAMVPYATPDGGALQWQSQAPPSINNNGNVEAGEYVAVSLCSITNSPSASNLDGDCDIDLADYALFKNCLNGPGAFAASTCQPGVNANLDVQGADVDLADFRVLQSQFGGD